MTEPSSPAPEPSSPDSPDSPGSPADGSAVRADPGWDPRGLPVLQLDPSNLRGLAHPLRLRVLGLLRRDGPSTATRLGAQLGESSGSLSYHLRQLAAHGLVVEDERPGGRERWWRAVHRATRFDDSAATPDQRLLGAEFLRAVGRMYADRLLRYTDRLETLEDEVGAEYARVSTASDWVLRLRPERARALAAAIEELVESYRETPDEGEDIVPVSLLFALMVGEPR